MGDFPQIGPGRPKMWMIMPELAASLAPWLEFASA
jgi:hypothetical protein